MGDHYSRRTTFDEWAEYYDETANPYPSQLTQDIIQCSGIANDGRILEVGCGTGQATQSFAERGYSITAIELGKNLAALASKNLEQFPKVQIINMAFEDWELELEAFDLAIAAEAFHWIPPEIGYPKISDTLKPGGSAAFFWKVDRRIHAKLSDQIQQLYQEIAPDFDNPLGGSVSTTDFLNNVFHRNIKHAEKFSEPIIRKYPHPQRVSAEQHIKQLYTFASHREMDKVIREELYSRIEEVINNAGGELVIEQEVMLFLVKKQ